MHLVTAVVRPSRLDMIRDALTNIGVTGMTVSEVHGFGRQRGHKEFYRGAEYQVAFVPKVKIEVAIEAERSEAVIETIREGSVTGKVGDGKIFVLDLEKIMRVRTGEINEEAI